MKTTLYYLDAIKRRFSLPSDYAISKKLDLTRQQISKYRNNGEKLSDEGCIKVAELLELPPAAVLADIAAEKTKCPNAAKIWCNVSEAVRKHAALSISAFVIYSSVFILSEYTNFYAGQYILC